MATTNIGRVTPIWRGFYSAATTYELNDIVIDTAGSVWWHKSGELTTGVIPEAGEIWDAVIDMSIFSELIQAAITTAQTALEAAQAAVAEVTADTERAETAADNAENSAAAASESAAGVGAYAQAAEQAKNAAQTAASQAAASASSAGASATSAGSSAQTAEAAKTAAQTAATQAAGSAETASGAAAVVEQKKTEAIAAIEAKGEEVLESIPEDYTELSGDVGELKIQINDLFLGTVDLTSSLENGYYVTNQATGETVPTTKLSSNSDKCGIFSCKKGDVFTITGKGGSSNRTWAFTDTEYKMLSKAGGSASVSNLEKTATQDGYFFFNSESNQNPSVKKTSLFVKTDKTLTEAGVPADAKAVGDRFDLVNITNPYDLAWFYGELSSSNHLTYNDKGLVTYNTIHVQAGSSISISSGNKFNAYIAYDDGTTGYKNFNTSAFAVSKSGKLRIAVGNSGGTSINNMAVLDTLTLDLIVKKEDLPVSAFVRNGSMIGNPPTSDYIGQHTDTSGFNQTTDYATAIAPWRDLPTDASGYIAETDLGAIYEDGSHQYKYTLTPPNRSISGKVLPHVFITTSLHGHEKSATYGLLYLIQDMLEHSTDDPTLFYLRNYVRFTILPMANPYGWDANSSFGTHGGIRHNENGVNLNRNFGTSAWSNYDDDPDYTTPDEYNYRGTAQFSEAETKNIKSALIATHNDISLLVDIHTYGTDTTTAISITYVSANKDNAEAMKNLTVAFDQYLCGIKNHMDEVYGVDLGLSQVYGSAAIDNAVNMTMQDYGYDACRVPSMTLEVPCGSTNGYLGTQLSKYSADTIKLCGEMIGNMICKALWYINQATD